MASGCETSSEYLRRVRRLRGRYAHRPGELHRRLKGLHQGQEERAPDRRVRSVRSRTVGGAVSAAGLPTPQERFGQFVAGQVQSGILRYSSRLQLLAVARRMGIGRFDANLIIATVQHRLKQRPADRGEARPSSGALSTAATFLLVQGAIAATVWRVFFQP